MPVIPALGRLRQEAGHEFKAGLGYTEFKASMDYILRACLKKPKSNEKTVIFSFRSVFFSI